MRSDASVRRGRDHVAPDPFVALAEPYQRHLRTLRGRLRQDLVDRRLTEHIAAPPGQVLDYGGGDGSEAVRWALRGYEVTLVVRPRRVPRGP